MTIEDVVDGFGLDGIGDFSDGYHTFNDLYWHRAVLFAVIVNSHPEISWKSRKHSDNCYPFGKSDMFIVGIDTPRGQYSYHYGTGLWDLFRCKVLSKAPEYDGHKPEDVVRLLSIDQ